MTCDEMNNLYEKQTKFKEIKNTKCDSEIGSKPKTRLTVEESKIESKKEATLTNRQYTEESSNGVVTIVSQIGLEMKNHTLKKDNNISPAHALDFSLTNNTREIGKGLITETMVSFFYFKTLDIPLYLSQIVFVLLNSI